MRKKQEIKERDTTLDDLYGCAVPADCDTSLYTDITHRSDLVPLFDETGDTIVGLQRGDDEISQEEDPLYGVEKADAFTTKGYQQEVLLMSERIDENGNSEFYPSGKTKKWVYPNVA